jgi:hypothetical protein
MIIRPPQQGPGARWSSAAARARPLRGWMGALRLRRKRERTGHAVGRPLSARPWDCTSPLPGEVAALRGDVRQPGLGLDGASLAEIVRGLDLVIHGAAATGFNVSERVYRGSDPATRSNYSAIRRVERAC